ncbi:hypothetical protein [Pseudonocardia nigra]|uniref:hypothetical protein n=1 Tax=Pseudonocardia nigra TaxID=1921578 RepID=UPI001C5FE925|nr:hypothetical protein [Pseudonocardia nigra]
MGAALAAAGRPPLTNATPGHRAGFVWLREHFVFTETTEQDLPMIEPKEPVDAGDPPAAPSTEILVKGTEQDLIEPGQRLLRNGSLPSALAGLESKVVAIELLGEDHPEAMVRRGCDPLDPWTDPEARSRARRYWPIGADRVAGWLRDLDTMPDRLLLGILEPGRAHRGALRLGRRPHITVGVLPAEQAVGRSARCPGPRSSSTRCRPLRGT